MSDAGITTVEVSPFDNARFYEACDSERLSHDTVEDAVYARLDQFAEKGDKLVDLIARHCPIVVTAWNPMTVDDDWIKSVAQRFACDLAEAFAEDFGDPDGDGDEMDDAAEAAFAQAVAPLIRATAADCNVWQAEEVQARAFDEDVVRRMFAKEIAEEEKTTPATKETP